MGKNRAGKKCCAGLSAKINKARVFATNSHELARNGYCIIPKKTVINLYFTVFIRANSWPTKNCASSQCYLCKMFREIAMNFQFTVFIRANSCEFVANQKLRQQPVLFVQNAP
jgi:hypothetical protein